MPVTIGVQGGATREVALQNVSGVTSDKAKESLQQIRTHLSQPGRDSGVLTLFNRTNTRSEMTLERKSGFQLLFHKDQRLDDTRDALKTLLQKAGLKDAVAELDNYLVSQGGKQNRISSSKMFEILNRHLPPLEKGTSFENLCTLAKIERVQELGRGAFGSAHLVNVDGKECVLKEFAEPELLSLKRTARPNEAIGSYLTSKQQPGYLLDKVNVAQPTSYMVSVQKGEKQEYQMVSPHEMRTLVKEAMKTGSEVLCHGIVMPKAKGKEMAQLIREGTLTEPEKKQFIRSTLQSIKGLNERGFVHRDIKPANSYFDRQTGTTTLIDTGMLFKMSKDQLKHPSTEYIAGGSSGTPVFMHPRAVHGQEHGTETDLYAVGVMALQVDHPVAFRHLMGTIAKQNLTPNGITKDWLRTQLDLRITEARSPDVKDALVALRKDIDDPGKISGFAMKCFEMAGHPAEYWKDRDWSQKTYSDLLLHAGLQ